MTRMTNEFTSSGERFSTMRRHHSERQLNTTGAEREAPARQSSVRRSLLQQIAERGSFRRQSEKSLAKKPESNSYPVAELRRSRTPPTRNLNKQMSERVIYRSEGMSVMNRQFSERSLGISRDHFDSSFSSIDSSSEASSIRSARGEERFTSDYWSKRYSKAGL